MSKHQKVILISAIIIIQCTLAIAAGIATIYFTAGDPIPKGFHVVNVDIGGISKSDAVKKVDQYFNKLLAKGSLVIAIEEKKYNIAYSDIDAAIDSKSSVSLLRNSSLAISLTNLFKTYFGHENVSTQPVITVNADKLRNKLTELSKQINRKPVNASISIVDGKVVKKLESAGIVLNVENSLELIKSQISINPEKPIIFNVANNYELKEIIPETKLKDLDNIDQIIAEYSTEIVNTELEDSVKTAANALNGVILTSVKESKEQIRLFSYVENLKNKNTGFENDSEGYDQVASTLYAALLKAGINKDSIIRDAHENAIDYIEPGLDAWLSGKSGDLKFSNTLDHKIAILSAVNGNKITVWLVGSMNEKIQDSDSLSIEVVQKFDPPVVNIENTDLKSGEKVLLTPGKEGLLVKVYRNKELISTDRYEATQEIVQVGPETDWGSNGK